MIPIIWILLTFTESVFILLLIASGTVYCAAKTGKTNKVPNQNQNNSCTSDKSKSKGKKSKTATSPGSKTKSPIGTAEGNTKLSDESCGGTTEDKPASKMGENKSVMAKSKGMQTAPDTLNQKTVDEGGKSCCSKGNGATVEDESHKPNNKCSKVCSSAKTSTVDKTMNSHLMKYNAPDDGGYDNVGPPPVPSKNKDSADSNHPAP